MPPLHPFWQKIDGVAVINLAHRGDRWREIEAQAARIPAGPQLVRIEACLGSTLPGFGRRPWFRGRRTDPRWAARAGCTASHRRVMLHAQQQGWKTTLVLEDDCDLEPLATCDLDALHRVLFVEHPGWQVCYLGQNEILPPSRRIATCEHIGELVQVRGCMTAHAYLVRSEARDWIAGHLLREDAPWAWLARHRIVDRLYARQFFRHFPVFALSPALLWQIKGYSDIGQNSVDWANMEMVHAVPVSSGFAFRLKYVHLCLLLLDFVDIFRGWWRRLRGF